MTISYPQDRDALRLGHSSSLQVQEIKTGKIYEARMFDFSANGIYFETDGVFKKGSKIHICIQNSPFSSSSGVLDYHKGKIMWQKDLKNSYFRYGYGVQFIADLRDHPRKPFSRAIRFGTHNGVAKGWTKNISASGIFIATEEKFEVGQSLKLSLPLKDDKTAEVMGKIIWSNEEGFGIKFQKIK